MPPSSSRWQPVHAWSCEEALFTGESASSGLSWQHAVLWGRACSTPSVVSAPANPPSWQVSLDCLYAMPPRPGACRAQQVLEVGGKEGALAGLVDDILARQRPELVDQLPARLAAH